MMGGQSWGIPPKEATDPRSQARRAVFETFQKRNPDVRIVNSGGLPMTGDRAESYFLMSMAGDTAPDVFYVNFRQYTNYVDQGFCRPLDDLIAADKGSLSHVLPNVMRVLKSVDGRIYAMPWFQVAMGLYYRRDHFAQAGLDPNRPPQNWQELQEYSRKLTMSAPGRSGFVFSGPAYHWADFVWQAGGDIVREASPGVWRAAIATPEAAKALEFYRRINLDKWTGPDGKTYGPAARVTTDLNGDIRDGKVSMWMDYTSDVLVNARDVNPALLGVAALPAGPAGRANEVNAGMWAINAAIKDPKRIEAAWRFIRFFSSDEAARVSTQRYVELGLGAIVNPTWLRKFGYPDLARQVDPEYVKASEEAFAKGHPEPYGRNCQQVYPVLDAALQRATLEPNRPALDILRSVASEMDTKLLNYTPPDVQAKRRSWAVAIFGLLTALGAALALRALLRSRSDPLVWSGPPTTRRATRFVTFCLAPAALSILVWSYYPLARGLLIAFQDYRITQTSRWVGLDNFIAVFTQPIFYKAIWNSLLYVALSIGIGFLLPVFLALALNEIPRFKVLFRTIYYLPAMTSPIVIAFLWRQMYDKSETGILNSLLAPLIDFINPALTWLHIAPLARTHDWLGDPSLAMLSVVIPGIWAGAGPGSILYLAALKNIPAERYEAADLDGANWIQKIRHIVFPGLRPLLLINLLGAFIGGFKAMENVFVLTGGGPLYATHTLGLEVWTNAFMFLRFGYATAAAWVMGSILVGFTLLQLRTLLKMRFSTARV